MAKSAEFWPFPEGQSTGRHPRRGCGRLWKRDEMIYQAYDIQKSFTRP
jgi:hypothetical protein